MIGIKEVEELEELIEKCSNPHSIATPLYWGFEEGLGDAMMIIQKWKKKNSRVKV